MESQVVEADTSNPLLRVLEVNRTAEGLVGRLNHFNSRIVGPRLWPISGGYELPGVPIK